MHPRIAELFAYLDREHESLRATFDGIPVEQREVRPRPEQWSAADVIGHLALIERGVGRIFTKLVAEARARGLRAETETSAVLPTIDLARVLDRSRKIEAPERVDPRRSPNPLGWTDYEQTREQLKAAILEGDGLALGDLSYPHPLFGPMGLYEWIAFTGAHAARHAAQIREVVAAISPPGERSA